MADGDGDGSTGVGGLGASDETLGTYFRQCLIEKILSKDIPSMAMQRTTFSPRCCCP